MIPGSCEKSFDVESSYSNFYAGGDIAWSNDGRLLYCLNTSEVCVVDVKSGLIINSYGVNNSKQKVAEQNESISAEEVEEDLIYCFALSPQNDLLITGHRSGLLRLWSLDTGSLVKLWKSQHRGAVVKLAFNPDGRIICSSGSDSSLRIWDFLQNRCVAALKEYSGPAQLVEFHPSSEVTQIYAAGSDNIVYCWNYATKKILHTFKGHLSQVTALAFEIDNEGCRTMITVSRDKVLIVWNLEDGQQRKVLPMYEELEGVWISNKSYGEALNAIVVTTSGNLKLLNCQSSKITTLIEDVGYEATHLLHCLNTMQLAVVTAEQNILIYDMHTPEKLTCSKQLIGFNDEILDLCLVGDDDRFLAVATNSKNLKVYDLQHNMNCKIVGGHKDTVMSLSSPGCSNFLLSAGRDFGLCLWEVEPQTFTVTCVGKNVSGHTSTIGSIAFTCKSAASFASACQSGSLKVWEIKTTPNNDSEFGYTFQLKYAAVAHQKEINCVTYSPNNKMIATASQDKTTKLWSSETNTCLGTLRGHTRGVWSVRFSPVDQVVLTSSSDCSLRLWSLATMTSIKRFEQECTVLRSEFIDNGKFIVSSSSDGLIKIWNIKTNECVQILDQHEDRVWALAVSTRSKKTFYSGGADSKLIKWQDVTEIKRNAEIDGYQELVQQEQILQSLLQEKKNMHKAFMLALKLDKPRSSFQIMQQFVCQRNFDMIRNIIGQLNVDQRGMLLNHVKVWCTNSRQCQVANYILNYLLIDHMSDKKRRMPQVRNAVQVITPYMQRHFNRVSDQVKDLAFLEFIVKNI